MTKVFAPEYERNDDGLILFPENDTSMRKGYFTEAAIKHRAKINLYLQNAVIDYVSEPDERVMDIMAGTGSIMMATLSGRYVTMIEISEKYCGWIRESQELFEEHSPGITESMLLVNASAQKALPLPTDHIIFSPPYANIMQKRKFTKGDISGELYNISEDDFTEYAKQPDNVGNRNRFFYNMEMEKIYRKCYESVQPGGTLTVVIKDYIEKGERVFLSKWVTKVCRQLGFEEYGWFKWPVMGSAYTRIHRSQGWNTVDEEDIIMFRRPE